MTIRSVPAYTAIQAQGSMAVDVSAVDVDFVALSKRVCRLVVANNGDVAITGPGDSAPQTITSGQLTAMGGVIDQVVNTVHNSGTTASGIRAFFY